MTAHHNKLLIIILTLTCNVQDTPQDYLNTHNSARDQVGIGHLTWDNTVAAYAQKYANQQKGDYKLVHSGGPYGENIAWSSGDLSGTSAVGLWEAEKADYDYNSNTCAVSKVCGHYTHVVWRNSVRVGCAKVHCNNGGSFIGYNYDPPGNFNGQKPYTKNQIYIYSLYSIRKIILWL
ncbi:hypothetical protein UlMin_030635 [Ulmus minor]